MTFHRLLVAAFNEDLSEREAFTVLHDASCPSEDDELTCHARFMETETGLGAFFIHADDPEEASSYQCRLYPGLYEIETWTRRVNHPLDPEEWEEGINVLDKPRDPRPNAWANTRALPQAHMRWVWMYGPGIPHWEVRGTGALV